MAIQRLTAFEAEADIFGRLRRVSFTADGNALTIECIGVDEAATIIDFLSTGEMQATKAGSLPIAKGMPEPEQAVLRDSPVEATPAAPDEPEAAPEPTRTKSAKSPKPKRQARKPKAPKKAPEPAADDDHSIMNDMAAATDPEQQTEDWVSGGAEAQEIAEVEEVKSEAIEASKGGDLPAELIGAKKLRAVVGILHDDMGITHPDAIIAKCEEIQSQVPVLKRIKGNLKERVARTISILEISA